MLLVLKISYYICATLALLVALLFSPIIVFLVGLDVLFDTRIIPWITQSNKALFEHEIKKCTNNISKALNDLEEENTQHITLYIAEQLKRINNLASGIYTDETEEEQL